ncbi:hypothetical protein Bca4012_025901 [Brassica carinata]
MIPHSMHLPSVQGGRSPPIKRYRGETSVVDETEEAVLITSIQFQSSRLH